MKEMTTLQLVHRLNELLRLYNEFGIERLKIDHKIEKLDEEWNAICYELWNRIPNLKEDSNLQLKGKKRVKKHD